MTNRIKRALQFVLLCSFAVATFAALQTLSINSNTDQTAGVAADAVAASSLMMSVPSNAVAPTMSKAPTGPKWVCNQGAYCTTRRDPACGIEGYCNLASNCCMCW